MSDNPQMLAPRQPFLSLNLGHVLTMISILGGGAGAYYGMKAEISFLALGMQGVDQRVIKVETALSQLTTITVIAARQDEQLSAIRSRLDRIEQKQLENGRRN